MNLSLAKNSELIAEMQSRPDFPVVHRNNVEEIANRIGSMAAAEIDGSVTQQALNRAHREIQKLLA